MVTAIRVVGRKVGFPFNVWMVFDYYYFTKDPLDIKAVLHNLGAQNKASVYGDIAYLFPNSLLTTDCKYQCFTCKTFITRVLDKTWRTRRKEYLKSFKPGTLKHHCLDYFRNGADLVNQLKNRKGEFAISYDVCNRLTFKNFFSKLLVLYTKSKNWCFVAFSATSVGLNQEPEHFNIFADKLLE